MSPFLQTLLAGVSLMVAVSIGVVVGKYSETTVRVALPDGVEIKGLPSSVVDCLNWVSENFKDPTAGTYAIVCHGRSP